MNSHASHSPFNPHPTYLELGNFLPNDLKSISMACADLFLESTSCNAQSATNVCIIRPKKLKKRRFLQRAGQSLAMRFRVSTSICVRSPLVQNTASSRKRRGIYWPRVSCVVLCMS